jgi:hypothetical protein
VQGLNLYRKFRTPGFRLFVLSFASSDGLRVAVTEQIFQPFSAGNQRLPRTLRPAWAQGFSYHNLEKAPF